MRIDTIDRRTQLGFEREAGSLHSQRGWFLKHTLLKISRDTHLHLDQPGVRLLVETRLPRPTSALRPHLGFLLRHADGNIRTPRRGVVPGWR